MTNFNWFDNIFLKQKFQSRKIFKNVDNDIILFYQTKKIPCKFGSYLIFDNDR